jgi:hypothetical protein
MMEAEQRAVHTVVDDLGAGAQPLANLSWCVAASSVHAIVEVECPVSLGQKPLHHSLACVFDLLLQDPVSWTREGRLWKESQAILLSVLSAHTPARHTWRTTRTAS